MAISLEQTGRTPTSVTFSVSGITGDRSTYVWNVYAQEWITLNDANNSGYIRSFSIMGDPNGSITVNVYESEYKVWQFIVCNVVEGSITEESDVLNTVLEFEFDNSSSKYSGDTIDITVDDIRKIGLFGLYMKYWMTNEEAYYYPLENVTSGDDIFADYLTLPAQNIYDAALSFGSYELPDRSFIINETENIIDNVYSGADFKASYFNNIKNAINNFNLRV